MDYKIAKGPGPGKKKQAKLAAKPYTDRAKANEKNRADVAKKMNSDPRVKKQIDETIMRNTNAPKAIAKGLGTKNEYGLYAGTQKGALTTKEKKKVVKFKSKGLNPKFRSES